MVVNFHLQHSIDDHSHSYLIFFLIFRVEVLEAIPNVEVSLLEWQKSHEALSEAGANLQDGHNLMAMLKVFFFMFLIFIVFFQQPNPSL